VEWSQNDTPVASRTRNKTHSQGTASKCMVDYEEMKFSLLFDGSSIYQAS
jgi:hypothetical protein